MTVKYSAADHARVMALVAEGKSLTEIEAATGGGRTAAYRMRKGTWQGRFGGADHSAVGTSALARFLEPYLQDGCSVDDLTVLSYNNDPFRCDNVAGHRDGAWLRDTAERLGLGSRRVHLRGLHYMILGQPKPDGTAYVNDYESWSWLKLAVKAARWLGYVPFGQITDQRNAEPVIRFAQAAHHSDRPRVVVAYQETGLPPLEEYEPYPLTGQASAAQAYRIAMVGEKSSLEPVLRPLADSYETDLYLPTGRSATPKFTAWPPQHWMAARS
jgi:hypothetical protein